MHIEFASWIFNCKFQQSFPIIQKSIPWYVGGPYFKVINHHACKKFTIRSIIINVSWQTAIYCSLYKGKLDNAMNHFSFQNIWKNQNGIELLYWPVISSSFISTVGSILKGHFLFSTFLDCFLVNGNHCW